MGAILGIAGVGVLVVLIVVLWMTGATRPSSQSGAGPGAAASPEQHGRRGDLN